MNATLFVKTRPTKLPTRRLPGAVLAGTLTPIGIPLDRLEIRRLPRDPGRLFLRWIGTSSRNLVLLRVERSFAAEGYDEG
jgi:hypothetical protein